MYITQKNVLTWKLPSQVTQSEREKWNTLLAGKKVISLMSYRNHLLKKYKLPVERSDLQKQLGIIVKEEKQLEHELDLEFKEFTPKGTVVRFTKNPRLTIQLIQAYKRKLMVDSLDITQLNKNKVIEVLEMLDINDAMYKNPIVQRKLIGLLTQFLPPGYKFTDFNAFYYNRSIEIIAGYLQRPPNLLEKLTFKLTFVPGENKTIVDFYGHDLFDVLYRSNSPSDFYTKSIQNNYNVLHAKSQIIQDPEYRRLKVLFNPYTGLFGREAANGFLFDVEKLAKGNDNLPLEDYTHLQYKDERTGQYRFKKIKVPIPGKFPFIKVPVPTTKKTEEYIWLPVKESLVKMYPANYDSCERFTNEGECNTGIGLGNRPCSYNRKTRKCEVRGQYSITQGQYNISPSNQLALQFGKRKKKKKGGNLK
jgi:hypothetical protein